MAAGKCWYRSVIERIAVVLAGLGLAWLSWAAEPEDARSALAARLEALSVFSAEFDQTVYGARGETLEVSRGYVRLQRPDFKWVVEDPYPQTIVTEGEVLKLYDPDLEQLTIRPLAEALDDTPVSLLTRDSVTIGERFHVTRLQVADEETFVIDPLSGETLYREIRLVFDADGFTGLEILDHLGSRTEIRFAPEHGVTAIAAGEFVLEVPPDTDVIGG
jgi:outer membrane lipoprotein carrier protein